ncbi:MAG: DUF2334 domain-containing protein [Rhizobiaceae bacterium]|nr:DUF2334 domain-containing protein [Rhizobiaceae bacterium]
MVTAGTDNLARFYVPEVHDVHPGMEDRLEALLDVWPAEARPHLALLVVPNWQDRFPLAAAPRFAERVAQLPGERVLHGWTHSLGPDWWNWLMYGHDNRSEFASLNRAEALQRVSAAMDAFASHFAAKPKWFCAPRWQQSRAATEVLREAGVEGCMLGGSLQLFSGASAPLPALNFDEGPRKLKAAVLRRFRETTIGRRFREGKPFRVALHPDDVSDEPTWRQVGRVIARLADEGWTPIGPSEAMKRFAVPSPAREASPA